MRVGQLYYLIDEKSMTRFAVNMELYYTLNYSYHKIDTAPNEQTTIPYDDNSSNI